MVLKSIFLLQIANILALSAQPLSHSVLSPQASSHVQWCFALPLSTQHSALSTQHSALSTGPHTTPAKSALSISFLSLASQPVAPEALRIRPSALSLKLFGAKSKEGQETEVSKHAAKFTEMVEACRAFDEVAVLGIKNERMRTVLAGLIKGLEVKEVEMAFRVLYEDYPPIRIAGNFIFDAVSKAVQESAGDPSLKEKHAGMASETLHKARSVFSMVDVDGNGELDTKEVQEFLEAMRDNGWTVEWSEAGQFIYDVDADSSGSISFAEFAAGARDMLGEGQETEELVQKLATRWRSTEKKEPSAKQSKYTKRFEDMCANVERWETIIRPESIEDKRKAAILEGCYVGARTVAVREALKVLYTDFGPLRMGGDLIYRILRSVVPKDA